MLMPAAVFQPVQQPRLDGIGDRPASEVLTLSLIAPLDIAESSIASKSSDSKSLGSRRLGNTR
jgi:hypothetical protein